MKKIFAILLLLIMILCSSGLYISYQLSLYSIRHNQREAILHSNIFKNKILEFSFPLNYRLNEDVDLVFVEEDEIMLNGKMYDIVSHYASADSIFIKCISDKTEDQIRDELSKQIHKNNSTSNQKDSPVIKFDPGLYITASSSDNLYNTTRNTSTFYISLNPGNLPAPYLNMPSPPPWVNV